MTLELNNQEEPKKKSRFDKYLVVNKLIIKNPSCFDIAWTPPRLIERKENDDFYRELSKFIKYRKSNNLFVKGFPGSGKSVTVEFVKQSLEEHREDFKVFNINCYSKSSSDVLKVLTAGQTKKTSVPVMLENFLKALQHDAIIFLDEIDRSDKISSLLYGLSRPKEFYPEFKKNINIILISNNFAWEESIPDNIRSSLQLKPLVFKPYNVNHIKNILKQRIKYGFINEDSISEDLINKIAEKVVSERRSDCRLALDILFIAAAEAEDNNKDKIYENFVEKALRIATRNIDKKAVTKLSDDQLLTLFAICQNNTETLEQLHKNYVRVIRQNKLKVKEKSKIMVFHMLNYLEDLGIINKKIDIRRTDNVPVRIMKAQCIIDKTIVFDELSIRGLRLLDGNEQY